ncbi:MAG: RNA-binding protein [Thaumarchaeota archaeon]|nr:RNA-binding protein [Nitrososphaerota archaeon]
MSFMHNVKIPRDRVGVLIGKKGKVKDKIEKSCGVKLEIDSEGGDVMISNATNIEEMSPFKAVEIVTAIAKGFSPNRADRLLHEEVTLHVQDLKEFTSKSNNALERIKGRIIGLDGKARKVMEELSGAYISVYGHSVAMIGNSEEIRLVNEAVTMLAKGSTHKSVYNILQAARRRAKLERLKLWEDNGYESRNF